MSASSSSSNTSSNTERGQPSNQVTPTVPVHPQTNDIDRLRRNRKGKGPTARHRRERERIHSNASTNDLIRLLISEEHESKNTRKLLYTALDRLDVTYRHSLSVEARADDTAEQCRVLTQSLMAAKLDASRAREELAMYKLQLDTAQKEILRAQDILRALEAQRDEAEASAARARTTARTLNERHLVRAAREEGRRVGFEEGIRRARHVNFDDGGYDDDDERSARRRTIHADMDDDTSGGVRGQDQFHDDPNLRPESIRIRTPSITSNPLQDGQSASGRRSVTSIARPSNSARPLSTHTQTSTRTRRNSEVSIPPDGWIPHAGPDHTISIPPPNELGPPIPGPIPSTAVQSQDSASQGETSSSRPYSQPRRPSSPDSMSSTTTGISQLGLVSFPNPIAGGRSGPSGGRDREKVKERGLIRNLGVIRESSRSPSGSFGHGVGDGRSSPGFNPSKREEEAEWADARQSGGIETPNRTSMSSQTGHRRMLSDRSRSATSPGTGSMSGSASITFDFVSPSPTSNFPDADPGPSSFSGSHPHFQPQSNFLSPHSAHMILPPHQPQPQRPHSEQARFIEVPTVPNSPSHASSSLDFGSSVSATKSRSSSRSGIPFGSGFPYGKDNDSGPPVMKTGSQSSSPSLGKKTHRENYAVAAVPAGVVYPDPASLRTGTPRMSTPKSMNGNGRAAGSASTSANGGENANVDGSTSTKEGLRRMPSNASLKSNKSYARYDPSTYLDPAYYARGDPTGTGPAA